MHIKNWAKMKNKKSYPENIAYLSRAKLCTTFYKHDTFYIQVIIKDVIHKCSTKQVLLKTFQNS